MTLFRENPKKPVKVREECDTYVTEFSRDKITTLKISFCAVTIFSFLNIWQMRISI